MKILYVGANRRVGVSAKSGKPYDICEVSFLVPDESGEKRDEGNNLVWTYTAHGHRVQTIECKPDAISIFDGGKSPAVLELEVEPKPNNPSRNWVVGLK